MNRSNHNVGLRGSSRHTAPAHRRADDRQSDEQFAMPLLVDNGQVGLAHGVTLMMNPNEELVVDVETLAGKTLQVVDGKLTITPGQSIPTLAADQTTASVGYVQAEAQDTMDKVDAILGMLERAGFVAPA